MLQIILKKLKSRQYELKEQIIAAKLLAVWRTV